MRAQTAASGRRRARDLCREGRPASLRVNVAGCCKTMRGNREGYKEIHKEIHKEYIRICGWFLQHDSGLVNQLHDQLLDDLPIAAPARHRGPQDGRVPTGSGHHLCTGRGGTDQEPYTEGAGGCRRRKTNILIYPSQQVPESEKRSSSSTPSGCQEFPCVAGLSAASPLLPPAPASG